MANNLYQKARRAFLEKKIDWVGDTIKAALLSATYTPNLATDEFLSVIPGGAVQGTPTDITTKTVSAAGVANGDDVTFFAVTGSVVTQIVIYLDTGNPATSYLIALFDTVPGLLPFTPDGNDVVIVWNGAGIFSWSGC